MNGKDKIEGLSTKLKIGVKKIQGPAVTDMSRDEKNGLKSEKTDHLKATLVRLPF